MTTKEKMIVKREDFNDGFEPSGFSIELDCEPGSPRPDTYIEGVIKDTGLTTDDLRVHVGPASFGNWEFFVSKEKANIYPIIQHIIQERVIDLFNRKCIRYGSW